MTKVDDAGTFRVGGEIEVNRLGFGAMRITGPGIWGPPADRTEAVRTLERLADLGVNFVDTADSYGPNTSEELIRQVLHPYKGMLVATKAGFTRPAPDRWITNGNPDYLRAQALGSLRRLGVNQIGLWQLHRIDPRVPREKQFAAVCSLLDDGLTRYVGLSEVDVDDIKDASRYFPVSTVQNHYNLGDRTHEAVLDYCGRRGIGFIPFFPLAAGGLARNGTVLDTIANKHRATPGQIALAWLLRRSPVMLPIPGTSKVSHLRENVAAAAINLDDTDFAELDQVDRAFA
jgi:pyridoxine 4-dehydrogenase